MIVSCVIDEHPEFARQASRFVSWLESLGTHGIRGLRLHHVGVLDPRVAGLRPVSFDLELVPVRRFGACRASAYCNKLMQHSALCSSVSGPVALCDLDLAFLEDPSTLHVPGAVSARVVDKPNPPADVLRCLLDAAGLGEEPLDARPAFDATAATHRFNCNGGLYVLDASMLRDLSPEWIRWAKFCLDRQDILGKYAIHADQLGFMFAMVATGLRFDPLPDSANFPVHFTPNHYGDVPQRLTSIHYHRRIDSEGRVQDCGVPEIDRWISLANERLAASRLPAVGAAAAGMHRAEGP